MAKCFQLHGWKHGLLLKLLWVGWGPHAASLFPAGWYPPHLPHLARPYPHHSVCGARRAESEWRWCLPHRRWVGLISLLASLPFCSCKEMVTTRNSPRVAGSFSFRSFTFFQLLLKTDHQPKHLRVRSSSPPKNRCFWCPAGRILVHRWGPNWTVPLL